MELLKNLRKFFIGYLFFVKKKEEPINKRNSLDLLKKVKHPNLFKFDK